MLKFGALILCFGIIACGSEDKERKNVEPLSTEALPLDGFEPKRFSLVEPSDACIGIESFFVSYGIHYMADVEVKAECKEVFGEIYTEEELAEIPAQEPVKCAEDRRCFRADVSVQRGSETDRYDAIVVKFPDGKGTGVVGAIRKGNKHYLPRKGHTVFPGELLHDALSHLHATFKKWVDG